MVNCTDSTRIPYCNNCNQVLKPITTQSVTCKPKSAVECKPVERQICTYGEYFLRYFLCSNICKFRFKTYFFTNTKKCFYFLKLQIKTQNYAINFLHVAQINYVQEINCVKWQNIAGLCILYYKTFEKQSYATFLVLASFTQSQLPGCKLL